MQLPKYKCHKIVEAFKIESIETDDSGLHLVSGQGYSRHVNQSFIDRGAKVGGYLVRYRDGYYSYSPAEAFESGYTLTDFDSDGTPIKGLDFGEAIDALKMGKKVARSGWNGKGMFLFLLPGGKVPKSAIHDPMLRKVMDEQVEGDSFPALPTIRMWTADKKVLTGWLASQTDILSNDWEIVG